MNITPAPLPAAAASITAPTPLCSGSTATFSTPAIANATSYAWIVSGTGWSGTSTTSSINVTVGTGTGTITVAGVNSCGTGASFTLNNVVPTITPTATFTINNHVTYLNTNVVITYTGNAPGTATYTWNFDGGTASPGTGQGPQTVSWPTAGMKHVTLSVTNNGCTSTSAFTDSVLVNDPAGVATLVNDEVVDIVPNPNNGTFDIAFGYYPGLPFMVEVTDMAGRIVYKQQFDKAKNNKVTINTRDLPASVYTASIHIGTQVINKKVTIIK